jgi:hypothetical protein
MSFLRDNLPSQPCPSDLAYPCSLCASGTDEPESPGPVAPREPGPSTGTPLTPATLAAHAVFAEPPDSRLAAWVATAGRGDHTEDTAARAILEFHRGMAPAGSDVLIAVGAWCTFETGDYPTALTAGDVDDGTDGGGGASDSSGGSIVDWEVVNL